MTRHPLRWQSLPKPALEHAQLAKLRRYLARDVLPFSPHYGELFRRHGLKADALRRIEDLQRIPFTAKADLLVDPKQFVLMPERKVLARRPDAILGALLRGRYAVAREFEREFRPV